MFDVYGSYSLHIAWMLLKVNVKPERRSQKDLPMQVLESRQVVHA